MHILSIYIFCFCVLRRPSFLYIWYLFPDTFRIFHSIANPEPIAAEIEKKSQLIYPLENVFIRKVKVLKKPKFDLTKLMELHGDVAEDTGAKLDKIAAANTVAALKGAGGRL